jgi:hypothetical protein
MTCRRVAGQAARDAVLIGKASHWPDKLRSARFGATASHLTALWGALMRQQWRRRPRKALYLSSRGQVITLTVPQLPQPVLLPFITICISSLSELIGSALKP